MRLMAAMLSYLARSHQKDLSAVVVDDSCSSKVRCPVGRWIDCDVECDFTLHVRKRLHFVRIEDFVDMLSRQVKVSFCLDNAINFLLKVVHTFCWNEIFHGVEPEHRFPFRDHV